MKVQRVSKELENRVEEKVVEFICKAEAHFGRSFPHIPVVIKNIGKSAGQFRYRRNRITREILNPEIRINTTLLAENTEDFMIRTIPHEVAHYIDTMLHGESNHGYHWAHIMGTVFGMDNSRCHSYDTTNSKMGARRTRKFEYSCHCQSHQLTSIRHNKILKGASYTCRKCRAELTYDGKQTLA